MRESVNNQQVNRVSAVPSDGTEIKQTIVKVDGDDIQKRMFQGEVCAGPCLEWGADGIRIFGSIL